VGAGLKLAAPNPFGGPAPVAAAHTHVGANATRYVGLQKGLAVGNPVDSGCLLVLGGLLFVKYMPYNWPV